MKIEAFDKSPLLFPTTTATFQRMTVTDQSISSVDQMQNSDSLVESLTLQIQSPPQQVSSNLISSPSNLNLYLQALSPTAPTKARPLALLSLSQLIASTASVTDDSSTSSISSLFGPFLIQALKQEPENQDCLQSLSTRISIISLLTAISALDPKTSTNLLSDPTSSIPNESAKFQEISDEQPIPSGGFGLLSELLFLSTTLDENTGVKEERPLRDLSNFCLTELISTLASSSSTRKLLVDSKVQDFLQSQVKSSDSDIQSKTSLLASLAELKIKRGSKSSDLPQPQSKIDPMKEKANELSILENLFKLSRTEIIQVAENNPSATSIPPSICSEEFLFEVSRTSTLTSLESLSHLSLLRRSFREKIAGDQILVTAVLKISGNKTRSKVFPTRVEGESKASTSSSSYDLDSRLSKLELNDDERKDISIQYGIVSLISNLVTYSHTRLGAEHSKEQAQMRKLKEMANGKSKSEGVDEDETEDDPNQLVDKRSTSLIQSGAIQTLVGILFTPDLNGKTSISPSAAIRKETSKAIYGLCVKQDRMNRGKIIQEGGARALLSLGALDLATNNQAIEQGSKDGSQSMEVADLDLTACSALSLLLISHPPQMVLGVQSSITSVLPLITALYLYPTATDLQRFEAALALTNLSSLDESAATKVATCKAPPRKKEPGFLDSKNREESNERVITIGDSLEALILLENNLMLRRANVELLCNLVAGDEQLRKLWSGEKEHEASKSNTEPIPEGPTRSRTRIHALIAFCSPASSKFSSLNEKETANNVSLPLRLAASGSLAALSESQVACSHLLALGPRTLNHIVRLIDLTVKEDLEGFKLEEEAKIKEIKEEEDQSTPEKDDEESEDLDESEELQLHLKELNSWPLGSSHALSSLNLRGLAISASLASYLSWRSSKNKNGKSSQGIGFGKEKEIFVRAGFEKAVNGLVNKGISDLQQEKGRIEAGNGKAKNPIENQIDAMKKQGVKMGIKILKVLKEVGVNS